MHRFAALLLVCAGLGFGAAAPAASEPPGFYPRFGLTKSGEPLPDFTARDATGGEFRFSRLRGRAVVLMLGRPDEKFDGLIAEISRKCAANGVATLAVALNTARPEAEQWLARNRDRTGFTLLWDPAGPLAAGEGKPDPAAKATWDAQTVMRALFGGAVRDGTARLPVAVVVDSAGRLAGTCPLSDFNPDGLANLLLRAGVPLAAADQPAVVAGPEAFVIAPRVELIAVGAAAPDFTALDIDGQPRKISDHRGKVVVLDFWATWCGPCLASMPHTQEVAARYRDQGVVVIGSCTSDTRAKFEAWVRANCAKYPDFIYCCDPLEKSDERASRKFYGVNGIPTQIVIGRDGRVADIVVGYAPGEVLLDDALRKAGISVAPGIAAQAEADRKKRAALR